MERDKRPARRRCGGAILRGHEVLLIRQQHWDTGKTHWWFPGGGREPGETDEACVAREVKEEVGLEVRVERPLELPANWQWGNHAVCLCTPLAGEVRLGTEEGQSTLIGFAWVPIDDESAWEPEFHEDPIYSTLKAIQREAL